MADIKRAYRSSQLINPFGPGAIIELGDESLILADPIFWPKNLESIQLERLTKELGIWELRKPPILKGFHPNIDKTNAILAIRFPQWMFCPRCRKMEKWSSERSKKNEDGIPLCENIKCKNKILVPMRFVAACDHGHLQDVPWVFWAHKNKHSSKCKASELYFKSSPEKGSGLDALYIECANPDCGEKNSLKELMNQSALAGISCDDKQPWEFRNSEERKCTQALQVLQRGASNLYYPIVRSALDIPYDKLSQGNSLFQKIQQSSSFEDLQNALEQGKDNRVALFAEEISTECNLTIEEVINVAKHSEKEIRAFKIPQDTDLRIAEWEILSSFDIEKRNTSTFKARIAKWEHCETFGFEKIIERVVLLDKLREVRAFCGFERISPNDNVVQPKSSVSYNSNKSWLPATEVFGEGVFLEFNQVYLNNWEKNASMQVLSRIEKIQSRYANCNSKFLPNPNIKFLIIHSLAHLLIRQLSFESGYSSGALRERIYADENQAGLLIYTADGDSEGSLGGLVQQGEGNRLFPAILAALETANWCSNDPVCSEMESQGVMGLNMSACHSCTLISETSCEYNNLLLDRRLLIGSENISGFFSGVLDDA